MFAGLQAPPSCLSLAINSYDLACIPVWVLSSPCSGSVGLCPTLLRFSVSPLGVLRMVGMIEDLVLCVMNSLFADYVYFENSSSNPYLIRRIEELNKVRAQHGAAAAWP